MEMGEGEQRVPTIAMDYTYMGSNDDHTFPTLVVRDGTSGATMATVVKNKGVTDDWAVDQVVNFINFLAYNRVVLKSDQEPSIAELKTAIKRKFEGEAAMEESPVKDSRSNGMIEGAIREVQGMTRTLKDQIEHNTGMSIGSEHALIPWLIQHAGHLITCYKTQKDGRSPYQRLRGKRATTYLVPLGEKILFQRVDHSTKSNKLDSRWSYGIYLGMNLRSMESFVFGHGCVQKARNLRRLLPEDRWDKNLLGQVTETPWRRNDRSSTTGTPVNIDMGPSVPQPVPEVPPPRVLRLRIRKQDLIRHGATDRCPGCRATMHGQYTAAHTEACRRRLEEAIKSTPEGADRFQRRQDAANERVAEEIRKGDKRRGDEQEGGTDAGGDVGDDEKTDHPRKKERRMIEQDCDDDPVISGQGDGCTSSSSNIHQPPQAPVDSRIEHEQPHIRDDATDKDEEKDKEPKMKRMRTGEDMNSDEVLHVKASTRPRLPMTVQNYLHDNAVDLTAIRPDGQHWDLSKDAMKKEAWAMIKKTRPNIVIGSGLKRVNGHTRNELEAMKDAIMHVEAVCEIYKDRLRNGGYIIHEHSTQASTWRLPMMEEIIEKPEVMTVEIKGTRGVKYMRMTNCVELATFTKKIKKFGNEHADRTITDILSATANKLKISELRGKGTKQQEKIFDSVTGLELDTEKVLEARQSEVEYFRQLNVFSRIPRSQATRDGHKVIPTRWVDVDKGTSYRSRLVAKEIKTEERLDLFAATPPLETLKMLLMKLARKSGSYKLLHVDVSRAYMHAKATRTVYVEIPAEMRTARDDREDNVGLLNVSLYGTRDGALNWEKEYSRFMHANGYVQGKASPCAFYKPISDTAVTVHGDDFVFIGPEHELQRIASEMGKAYPIKSNMLGPGEKDNREVTILNRKIRWGQHGIEYFADAKHAKKVIEDMGVQGCKPVDSVGSKDTGNAKQNESTKLDSHAATQYRSCVARCNYLGQDRADLQFGVKEIAKSMASPTQADVARLKRLAKYLSTYPFSVTTFRWGNCGGTAVGYSDSDWAGDTTTRKSTSGGCITIGGCAIKSWARTQRTVALSSGEAELYAANRTAQELLGIRSLGKDLGMVLNCKLLIDAKATLGIISRRGLGRLRHIEVQELWLQSAVEQNNISVERVPSWQNAADMMTKYVSGDVIQRHLHTINVHRYGT